MIITLKRLLTVCMYRMNLIRNFAYVEDNLSVIFWKSPWVTVSGFFSRRLYNWRSCYSRGSLNQLVWKITGRRQTKHQICCLRSYMEFYDIFSVFLMLVFHPSYLSDHWGISSILPNLAYLPQWLVSMFLSHAFHLHFLSFVNL